MQAPIANSYFSSLQVKVWFQNRRTKHKRQQQEDDEGTPGKSCGDGDKSNEEGLIIEHEEEDEELDVLDEVNDQQFLLVHIIVHKFYHL